jgi:hypothetical protein
MTIASDGFLAPQIEAWIERFRSDNADAFAMAADLNRAGHQLMLATEVQTGDPKRDARTLAALLFVRVLSSFQGVVIMAERGMIVEARTLARTCLESTFALVAGVKDDEAFVPKMIAHSMDHRSKAANWLLDRANRDDFLSEASEDKLREFLAKLGDDGETLATFQIIEMARRAQLEDLYIFYRALSGDAAHPTLDALSRYVEDIGPGKFNIIWGPKSGAAEITDTLLMACSFVFAACVSINEFAQNTASGEAIEALWERYKILAARHGPVQSDVTIG